MIIDTDPCLFFLAIALTSWDWPYPTFRLEDYINEDQHKEHKGKGCVLHCKDDKRFQIVDLGISSLGKDLLKRSVRMSLPSFSSQASRPVFITPAFLLHLNSAAAWTSISSFFDWPYARLAVLANQRQDKTSYAARTRSFPAVNICHS